MRVLVSACLLGENCKYNGGNNFRPEVAVFVADKEVIPICPEVLAGLGAPRACAELVGGRVVDSGGRDLTEAFRNGVERAMEMIEGEPIGLAILQPRSPTCGVHEVYDGSFSGRLVGGRGLFAAELLRRGYAVIEPDELEGWAARNKREESDDYD